MGNSCTRETKRRDAFAISIRERKRQEEDNRRLQVRQRAIQEARYKALEDYNRRESESGTSHASLESSSVENGMSRSMNSNVSWIGGSFVSLPEVLLTEKPPAVICFISEIQQTDAPVFAARDHMGRQVEVLVSNPGAQCGDDDRFVPFFHPNSPLSCDAAHDFDTVGACVRQGASSRRLRFLEKSEDVQGHLKRMAPVNKGGN